MARAGGIVAEPPILCLPPATGDLPEHGGVVVSSPATPFRKPIEHAGHSYQQHLIRAFALNGEHQSSSDSDGSKSPTRLNSGSDIQPPSTRTTTDDAAKNLKSKMAIGSDDLYELLELGDKRWHATAEDIKKSFRRLSLIYHPDKISHHGDEARANSETHFKAVRKAYDILSDKKKRAAYDSIDDVDDSIPSEKDASSSPARFYEKFSSCFAMNARWSVSDRVPELGDDNADLEAVHRFYDFWYSFRSWRDFSFDLEFDPDQAESREEKRWMDRQNSKRVKSKKLEENARIRRLVDLAYKHDPRLVREKLATRAKKDAQKVERRRKAEEANKLAKEKEEKERQEAEKKATEDKLKRAEAKKERDAARQIVRKARQKLRAISRELQIMETERGLIAVEGMCADGTAESIEAVADALGTLPSTDEDRVERAYSILDSALSAPLLPMSTNGSAGHKATVKDSTLQASKTVAIKESSTVKAVEPVQSPSANETTNHNIPNGHPSKVHTQESTVWTQEELSLLSKGVAKFPGGTRDRWNRLAEYITTRSAEEILRKVSESRPSKMKPSTKQQQPSKQEPESNAFKRFQEKKKGKPIVPQTVPSKSTAKPTSTPSGQPPNLLAFTPKQQALFESALKKYPKGVDGRWKKVASAVGRTPQHCQHRFDELIAFYSAKKAAQQ